MEDIIFLKPVFKEMIWGGDKLNTVFGYDIPGPDTGECWGISAHPNGDCMIMNGKYAGQKLSWLWAEHQELFGPGDGVFPLLTKVIDAKADLSIQVHPDDEYADEHENGSLGKTECWYILDCDEGATLVVGHNAKDHEDCERMIRSGLWNEFIRTVPVKKGDFIQIEPGTVHAIKGGILLLETQQNSDITYRVYDYDRLSNGKKRELHVDKSIDVIKAPAAPVSDSIKNFAVTEANTPVLMVDCKYYKVWKLAVCAETIIEMDGYRLASVIAGEGTVNGTKVKLGDHFIIPMSDKAVFSGNMELILSTAK